MFPSHSSQPEIGMILTSLLKDYVSLLVVVVVAVTAEVVVFESMNVVVNVASGDIFSITSIHYHLLKPLLCQKYFKNVSYLFVQQKQ